MIQIDMPMPESCEWCPCAYHYWNVVRNGRVQDFCQLIDGDDDCIEGYTYNRREDCPLREVKEGQKDKYVAWLEEQVRGQAKKEYPEMVLAIYDAGKAYDAIHHLLRLLEESEAEPDA